MLKGSIVDLPGLVVVVVVLLLMLPMPVLPHVLVLHVQIILCHYCLGRGGLTRDRSYCYR